MILTLKAKKNKKEKPVFLLIYVNEENINGFTKLRSQCSIS